MCDINHKLNDSLLSSMLSVSIFLAGLNIEQGAEPTGIIKVQNTNEDQVQNLWKNIVRNEVKNILNEKN